MDDGAIVFDSDDVQSVSTSVNSDLQSLSSIVNQVSSNFSSLVNCNLFDDNLNQLVNNINKVKAYYSKVESIISNHNNEYINMENAISNIANNYQSYDSYDNNLVPISINIGNDINIDNVNNGKSISNRLDDEVISIDDDTIIEFIDFVKKNNTNISIIDIIKKDKINLLVENLSKFYKQILNKDLIIDNELETRKHFLLKMFDFNAYYKDLEYYSLFKYKNYLKIVGDENNCKVSELFTDPVKENMLQKAFDNLYAGKVNYKDYGLSENYQSEFKLLVDNRAKELNISTVQLLLNPLLLL